ncbi:MAG: XrtA/PEP-CTERM system TPR-repeat protein PrsT [Burkholderiales bacterium]
MPTLRSLLSAAALAAALAAAPLVAARAQSPAQLYENALARFEKNDVAGAVIQLKNALQQDPRLLAAHVLLGRALLAEGDAGGAEAALSRAVGLGVNRSEVALPFAQALFAQGKFQAVLDRLPPEAAPPAQRAALLVLRGRAQLGLGDARAAERSLQDALAADRTFVPALLALAELSMREGKGAEAAKLAEAAAAAAPKDPSVWHVRGTLAQDRGDAQGALDGYSRALALNERLLEPRVARATRHLDFGRLDDAGRDVAQLRKLHPRQPRALYVRALYASRRGDEAGTREALSELTRAIDPAPRELLRRSAPELLLIGGLAHHGLNQYEKASSYLADYLAVEPGHVGARKLLASIALAQGDVRDAIARLEPARKAAPKDPQVLTLLASAHMVRREYALASGYLDEALALSGGAAGVEAVAGFNLIASGQAAAGLQRLERAFEKDPGQSRAGLVLATSHLRRGNAPAAVAIAAKIVEREPKNPVALNLLGQARLAAGDHKGARAAYEAAVAAEPGAVAARVNLARLDLAERNVEGGRARLEALVQEQPQNTVPMYELALLEARAGRTDEAIRWLEKVRALDRRHVAASAQLIDLYVRVKAPDKATEVAKGLEAALPEDLDAQLALGRAYLALGDAASARSALTRATRLAGYGAARQTEIARYQVALGNLDGAVYSLDKALAGNPEYLPAQALMTEVAIGRRDFAQAETRAKAIVQRYPQRAVGYRLAADVAHARGRESEALAGYRAAHAKEPTTESAIRAYRALLQAGNAAQAAEFMEGWVKGHADDLLALRALADGYLQAKNYAAARARYERLLQRRGEDAYALNNLANVLLQLGDRGALAPAERAHALAPQDAAVQDTLGWVLVQQGQLERGLRHLREARLREPGNPEIRYHLAAALARAGRPGEARAELEQALKSDRPFDGAADARRLLGELPRS